MSSCSVFTRFNVENMVNYAVSDVASFLAMERYPSVKISDFDMHVKRLQANGNLKFSQEYEVYGTVHALS